MNKKYMEKVSITVALVSILMVIILPVGVICLINYVSTEHVTLQAYQEAMKKGIYEFDRSFELVVWQKWATAHFMICEPPKTPDELKEVVEKYVKDNDIVREVRNRIATEFPGEEDEYVITLRFYKPSSKFPIGWQARSGYDFTGGDIGDNIIFTILIEIDQNSKSKYNYRFEDGEWYNDF